MTYGKNGLQIKCLLLFLLLLCSCAGQPVTQESAVEFTVQTTTELPETETQVSETQTKKTEEAPYYSPYDFEALQAEYPDIIAWIDIPDTEISYPLFCHPEDDSYYTNHKRTGKYSSYGEIFIEYTYNKTDFTDPVTVIYGHKMKDGSMFGQLQVLFADMTTTAENPEIVIYTPQTEHHYTVFAATTFDNRHILYNYDLHSERIRNIFFEHISKTRSIDTFFEKDIYNRRDGNFVILSTCKNMNLSMRFLVFAVECTPVGAE